MKCRGHVLNSRRILPFRGETYNGTIERFLQRADLLKDGRLSVTQVPKISQVPSIICYPLQREPVVLVS